MKYLRIFIFFAILPLTSSADNGWQTFMTMTGNYFEGIGNGHQIVLRMEAPFHSCGNNSLANINLSVIGPEAFSTLSSVVLSSWIANKKLSLNVQGCQGDRAKVVALRIAK